MIKTNAIVALNVFTFLVVSGCMSMSQKQQMFIDERNHDVGRLISHIPVPEPTKITPINNGKNEYLIEFTKTGCQWIFVVDESTKKVENWRYASDPQNCYLEINWFGSW